MKSCMCTSYIVHVPYSVLLLEKADYSQESYRHLTLLFFQLLLSALPMPLHRLVYVKQR